MNWTDRLTALSGLGVLLFGIITFVWQLHRRARTDRDLVLTAMKSELLERIDDHEKAAAKERQQTDKNVNGLVDQFRALETDIRRDYVRKSELDDLKHDVRDLSKRISALDSFLRGPALPGRG